MKPLAHRLLPAVRALARLPGAAGVLLIRAYQVLVSPLFPDVCKYHPSCSQYAVDAVRRFGLARGAVLAAWRIARCNPWSAGGVDHAADQTVFAARSTRSRLRKRAALVRGDGR